MKIKVTLELEYKAAVGIPEESLQVDEVKQMVHATIWNAIENGDLALHGHDSLEGIELFNYLIDVQEAANVQ